MAVLAREGLIVRYRGAGSFVSHITAPEGSDEVVRGDVRALTSLTSVWTSEGEGRASPAEALALALAPHAGVSRFRQLAPGLQPGKRRSRRPSSARVVMTGAPSRA